MTHPASGAVGTEGLEDVSRRGDLAVLAFKRSDGAEPLALSMPVPALLDLALNALRLEASRAPREPNAEQTVKAVNLASFSLSGEGDGVLVLSVEPATGGCLNLRFDTAMARSLRDALDAAVHAAPAEQGGQPAS